MGVQDVANEEDDHERRCNPCTGCGPKAPQVGDPIAGGNNPQAANNLLVFSLDVRCLTSSARTA